MMAVHCAIHCARPTRKGRGQLSACHCPLAPKSHRPPISQHCPVLPSPDTQDHPCPWVSQGHTATKGSSAHLLAWPTPWGSTTSRGHTSHLGIADGSFLSSGLHPQASAGGVLGQALARTTASSSDWARGWSPEGPVCTAPCQSRPVRRAHRGTRGASSRRPSPPPSRALTSSCTSTATLK